MRVLGVDPGCGGAIALLDGGRLEAVHDMPVFRILRGKSEKREVDGYRLGNLIRELKPDIAFVELVGGITGQSAPAAFNFGRASGGVEYALKALGVRVELVPPGTWKKAMKVNASKDGARASACARWPGVAAWFARVKDDGRAEAALIAEWGRVQQGNGKDDGIFG